MAHDIFIPKLGMTMEEATIAEWMASDGDKVEKDQVILVIDTEKVAHEMESPASGFLLILAEPGQVHPCGAVVAKLCETRAAYEELKKSGLTVEVKAVADTDSGAAPESAGVPAREAPAPASVAHVGRIDISPVAKRIAAKHTLDYSGLAGKGSGPGGRIVKKDIEQLVTAQASAGVPAVAATQTVTAAGPTLDGKRIKEIIPLRGMRKTIAERMHYSASVVARVTGMFEHDMTEMIALRKYYNENGANSGVKITFTDLLLLIVSKALKAVPIINSSLMGDEIKVWADINIGFGVAVALNEKESGLVVPVIKNVDQKGLREIAWDRKDLTDKARNGKLSPDEMTGGTFTITNTGPIADKWHIQTPIINQPESAILGTSAIVEKPVVREGEIVIRPMMPMSFSFDHRIVDGGPVAAFASKLTELIEDPKMLIL